MLSGIFEKPEGQARAGLVLAHGAGSDCRSALLASVAKHLVASGLAVYRIDLAYRQLRPTGPPVGKNSAADRECLREAVQWLRDEGLTRVLMGGHSYGGRQATMLAADQPGVADGLLLLSYPLHPPRAREQLRTSHFPALQTPSLFIHGTRDPFGSLDEMQSALALIPGRVRLELVDRAGHDLRGAGVQALIESSVTEFLL